MSVVTRMFVGASGKSLAVEFYCGTHQRLLTYREMKQDKCWWCDPSGAPEKTKDGKPHPLSCRTADQVAAVLTDQRHDSHCRVHERLADDL